MACYGKFDFISLIKVKTTLRKFYNKKFVVDNYQIKVDFYYICKN